MDEALVVSLNSDLLSSVWGVCVALNSWRWQAEEDDNQMNREVLRNIELASSQNRLSDRQLGYSTPDESICVLLQVAGVSYIPAICSESVWCCMLVCRHQLKCTTAESWLLLHVNRRFFDRKDGWWWLSQEITMIIDGTDVKNWVILYLYYDYSPFSDGQNTEFSLFKVIKHTNLDMKDATCLDMVHILQHPTSLPITVNNKYNGQHYKKEAFSTSSRQIWQMDKAVHTTTSSRKWSEEGVGGREGSSPGSIA